MHYRIFHIFFITTMNLIMHHGDIRKLYLILFELNCYCVVTVI